VTLDGLNVALAIHTPGPMGEGNWAVGAYIDERADEKQTEALGAFRRAYGGFRATDFREPRGEEAANYLSD
jgi:hypothetical protein